MSQLQNLPSEVLLAIALHVPQSTLKGLAHTCRRLNQIVTTLLYESVLWQGDHHASRFLNDEAFSWQQQCFPAECSFTLRADDLGIPSSGSRIIDLDAFNRTIQSSESLRSLVKSVDLRWHNEDFNDDDSVRCCLQALQSSHLRTLHLSPADFSFEIPARPAVTSLAFQIDGRWAYNPHLYAVNFKRLYTLFCIPSLIHFSLDGWPFWSSAFCKDWAWAKSECVGTSKIEELVLTGGGAEPGDDLQEVLSWPKPLKRLAFVPNYLPHNKDSATIYSELQHMLQHQRLTLEYLHAEVPNGDSGKETFGRHKRSLETNC